MYELFTKLFTQFKTVFSLSLYPFLPRLTRFFELRSNKTKNEIEADLKNLINAGLSLSAAAKYLAKKNGLKKSEVYNLI